MRWKIAQMTGNLSFRGLAQQLASRARWPKALSTYLTDLVPRQLAVEGLVASTLLGWPKDPVLFHTGN